MESPFDVINCFFRPKEFSEVSNYTLNKHYFIINRYMGIDMPQYAAAMSRVGIYGPGVIKFWQAVMSRKYSRSPGWMFVKGAKKTKEETAASKKFKPSNELVLEYAKINKVDVKSVKYAIEHYPAEMKKEFKTLEDMMSMKGGDDEE